MTTPRPAALPPAPGPLGIRPARPGGNGPLGASGGGGGGGSNRVTNFLIAGAFVIGMGAGVAFDTTVDLEPANVASREILDRQTLSSEVMVNGVTPDGLHQRFMSLNPFNIYVAQPEVKPGASSAEVTGASSSARSSSRGTRRRTASAP